MIEVGKRVIGMKKYIPRAMLTESIPGSIYEIEIVTKGIPNPDEAIDVLRMELPKRFNLKVLWVGVENNVVRMQIIGSPFPWPALLAFLPEILLAIGIVVVLISVYLVFSHIPSWVYALLIIGSILTFGAYIGGAKLGIGGEGS